MSVNFIHIWCDVKVMGGDYCGGLENLGFGLWAEIWPAEVFGEVIF